jgi:hypothetical protein
VASNTDTPVNVTGATPKGRPIHHPANKAIAAQPELISGDSTSLLMNMMPSAWKSSELAGKKAVADPAST